jgi:hypothetical protein
MTGPRIDSPSLSRLAFADHRVSYSTNSPGFSGNFPGESPGVWTLSARRRSRSVGQTFLSAGSGDFPVSRRWAGYGTGRWKAPRTGSLERPAPPILGFCMCKPNVEIETLGWAIFGCPSRTGSEVVGKSPYALHYALNGAAGRSG